MAMDKWITEILRKLESIEARLTEVEKLLAQKAQAETAEQTPAKGKKAAQE